MIYVVEKEDTKTQDFNVISIWYSKHDDLKDRYKQFMLNMAKDINVIINPYYYNMMDCKIYHPHLSEEEYLIKQEEWNSLIETWTFSHFICKFKLAEKLDHKYIYEHI